jgi:hypothetical protein
MPGKIVVSKLAISGEPMSVLNKLAFRMIFAGNRMTANPRDNESLYEAILRTVTESTGSVVAECKRAKKIAGHFTYALVLENGNSGKLVVEGKAYPGSMD